MNDVIEKVRNFVEGECKKPTSKYGYEPFLFHFTSVVKYSKKLAEKKKADKEIVEIAAWLHDIGSILYGREDHHITSCRIAEEKLKELKYPEEKLKELKYPEEKLKELKYPEDKIERIKHCIYTHRGSKNILRETIEAEILAEADAMSNFDNIPGIFKASFIFENLNQGEARKAVFNKLKSQYEKLSPEGKEIMKGKFEAVVLLLGK